MPSLSSVRASNAAFLPTYRPTAVFVGGTSGIGEATAKALATATKGNVHIIICGRSKAKAELILETLPKTADSIYEFVECDARLMKNVAKAAAEIRSKISTLNFLVLSCAVLDLNGFTPTEEGIDEKLALRFYARWKFVDELMSNLESAVDKGQEARVMTVLAAGAGKPLLATDLGTKRTYSLVHSQQQCTTYNDLMAEEYSIRYPQMSFMHINPGFVNTCWSSGLPTALRVPLNLLSPIFAARPADCGQYMLGALLSPTYRSGAFYLGSKGDEIDKKTVYTSPEARTILVEHFKKEVATPPS